MHMMSVRIDFGVMDHRRDRRERSFSRSALRDKDFVPCKSYSSSHRPSPGKRDGEKSRINAFYETVVAARGS